MIQNKNIRNKSLTELAIADSINITEEEKRYLRDWLDGMIEFVNKAVVKTARKNKIPSYKASMRENT